MPTVLNINQIDKLIDFIISVFEDARRSPTQRNFDSGVKKSSSPLRSFTNIMERISPDKDSFIMKGVRIILTILI